MIVIKLGQASISCDPDTTRLVFSERPDQFHLNAITGVESSLGAMIEHLDRITLAQPNPALSVGIKNGVSVSRISGIRDLGETAIA
jgi:fibrillarin-like rRNA methylase